MVDSNADEMALPLGKRRTLPEWMIGAGKRVGVGQKKKEPVTTQEAPLKVVAKTTARAVTPKSTAKTKTKAKR